MVFGGSTSNDQYSDGLGFSGHSGRNQARVKRESEGMLDDKYLRSNSIVVNDHDIMNQSNYVHQLFDDKKNPHGGKSGKYGTEINPPFDMIINTKH